MWLWSHTGKQLGDLTASVQAGTVRSLHGSAHRQVASQAALCLRTTPSLLHPWVPLLFLGWSWGSMWTPYPLPQSPNSYGTEGNGRSEWQKTLKKMAREVFVPNEQKPNS